MVSESENMIRRNKSQFTKDIQLNCMPARDKKLAASVDSLNTHDSKRRDGGSQDSDFEWSSTPDVMSFKHNINFECSNSIPINFSEAWSYFQTCNMSSFRDQRIDDKKPTNGNLRCKLQNLVGAGNCPLVSALYPERDLIFSIASCPMMNDVSVHRRILQSIYVFLTKKPSCPRYGNHWEEIGFQGQDPASDLRGVGMFGALQLLYLSSSQETKETLAPEIFDLSRHPIHQFPLAVLSLNVTKMAVDAFRDGILNRFCHKQGSAVNVVNQFYLAIMYRIYRKWKDKRMTIHDSCYLLKAVEKWSRTHPKKTFLRLHEYLSDCGVSMPKRKTKSKKKLKEHEDTNLSWLDLTKPSLEVFI